MTRNEFKKAIIAIIQDTSISDEDERNAHVITLFAELAQGYGGRKATTLANDIEKETGFDMSSCKTLNHLGFIERKADKF